MATRSRLAGGLRSLLSALATKGVPSYGPFDPPKIRPYFPSPWLPGRHVMTIGAHVLRVPPRVHVFRERWELPDGDFLDADRIRGRGPDSPIVLICHGLEGSSKSGYVLGVMARAKALGLASVALNFRGCSGELNRLPRFYHSGETTDVAHAVERLIEERPDRPIALIGFSLGGNVVTKYIGERGDSLPASVKAAAVVSVPFDLSGCCDALDAREPLAILYRARFLRTLLAKACAKAERFPGLFDVDRARRVRLLRDYDEVVTAPIHGFASAADYYTRSSSGPFVPLVNRPLLVISAEDDPFVPGHTIPESALRSNPCVTPMISGAGGHVAFVGGPRWQPERWAEAAAVEFVASKLALPPT